MSMFSIYLPMIYPFEPLLKSSAIVPHSLIVVSQWFILIWLFCYTWIHIPFTPYILKAIFVRKGRKILPETSKTLIELEILLGALTLTLYLLLGFCFDVTILFVGGLIILFGVFEGCWVSLYEAQRYYNLTSEPPSKIGVIDIELSSLCGEMESKEETLALDFLRIKKALWRAALILTFHIITIYVWTIILFTCYFSQSYPLSEIIFFLLVFCFSSAPYIILKFFSKFLHLSATKCKVLIAIVFI
ncbi:MAG: hypothetical protein QXD15_06390, partial [Thermoplasmata archaeon]